MLTLGRTADGPEPAQGPSPSVSHAAGSVLSASPSCRRRNQVTGKHLAKGLRGGRVRPGPRQPDSRAPRLLLGFVKGESPADGQEGKLSGGPRGQRWRTA